MAGTDADVAGVNKQRSYMDIFKEYYDAAQNGSYNFASDYGDNNNYGKAEGYAPENNMYQVQIVQVNTGGQGNRYAVGASAPPSFNLEVNNNFIDFSTLFEGAFGGGQGSGRAGAALAAAAQTAGSYNQSRVASFQIWGGTSPLVFPLQIEFRAFKDPRKEVIEPVRNLLWMASGSSGNLGFLNSPSPSILDAMKAIGNATQGQFFLTNLNKTISVRVGTQFYLAGLIIENLSLEVSTAAERDSGLPMAIKANINFKTIVSYSREDILSAFYGNNFGTNVPPNNANNANAY